ncbi:MAG: glucosaminidase domain-containing protein [Hydrogenimonas sp.]|nr:glucosaminidase domain-containing protein [Hydrogenimonas sp.]
MIKIVMGVLLAAALVVADTLTSFPADYYKIKDEKAQKERFVKILYPLILKEEKKIELERKFVEAFFSHFTEDGIANAEAVARLAKIAKKYRIKSLYDKEEYLKKIDTIPVSLVLAKAAIESNWGKSRFAREANNLFGEWTWGKRGIVPKNRPEGKRYKIKIFSSLEESIASYMRNLNRHWAYEEFREARYEAKRKGAEFGGFIAASYLQMYSQLREKYTRIVKSTIVKHEWSIFDERDEKSTLPDSSKEIAMLLVKGEKRR